MGNRETRIPDKATVRTYPSVQVQTAWFYNYETSVRLL